MRRSIVPVVAFLALPSGPESSSVRQREEHYDLRGTTEKQLQDSIKQRGPEGELRGLTEWTVTWTFHTTTDGRGQCLVASVATRLDITVTLPRWIGADEAPGELRSRWDRALRDLRRHEQLHVANAVRTAKAIEGAVRSLPSAADCNALETDVGLAANQELAEGRRRDKSYDARHAHGIADR